MNTHYTKLLTPAAAMLALLVISHLAAAQTNCKEIKGNAVEVFTGGNNTAGTLTNAGSLNGATLHVFDPGASPTPWPTAFTFTGQFTLTTGQGQLKASTLYMLDVATLKGTSVGHIDPNASTGIFAGATGTVYTTITKATIEGTTETYHSELSGQICFARP